MLDEEFKAQKRIVYNKYLPYYDRLEQESVQFFAEIKYNIGHAVLYQEINPGLIVWCSRLDKYLSRYGRNFSKEDHVLLIKLFYQLLVIPNLEAQFVKNFAVILHKLLKKRELLTRDDLELPWRPLYELVESVRYSNLVRSGLKRYQGKFLDPIHQVIRFARCYFPIEATEEMLLEWRPLMCPLDDTKSKASYYFSKFIPAKLPKEYLDRGFKLWLSEFMNYWFSCLQSHDLKNLSEDYARLFMRVAEFNVGYIDWNLYLPKIFNQFLSNLNLPVNGAAYKGNPRYQIINMNVYAKWFVYMIGGESLVLDHLEKLFVAIESFYHPSNHGKYSVVLLGFLHSLTVHFVKRLHNERFAKPSWIIEIMESSKITDAEIEKFVLIVRDVTLFSVYNKSGSYQAASTIQNLALLRSDLILPSLLDRTYEALETLVEPHQVTATLNCITSVSRVLVTGGDHLPSAPTHLLRLLYLVLPGIDPNDFRKCMASFTLISSIIGLIPLVDCTPALVAGIEMTDIERKLCHTSAQFEDFVLQFIDRCFVLIEMSTAEEIAEQDNLMIENMNMQENMLVMGMLSTVQTVIMQSSPKLFESILACLFRFISSRVLKVAIAGRMVSDMCRAAAKMKPAVTLKKFLPFMHSIVKNLASVPGVQEEEHCDPKLSWYLEMLYGLVHCTGQELLPYKEMLREIIELTLHLKCKEVYLRTGKLLKAILASCSGVYVTEWCSISEGFQEPPENHFYIRDWGKPGNIDDLNVKWHIPSLDELSFVDELLKDFFLPELDVMKHYINGSAITRDELHQRLQIIGVSIVGASSVLPVWENEKIAGEEPDSLLARHQFSHVTTVEELESFCPCITRKEIAMLTHELFEYMLKNNEDDTKAFRIIGKIYDFLILHHGLNSHEYSIRWKTAAAVKKALADQLHGNKLHLRAILIERVQLQHDTRLISKRLSRFTVIDQMIVEDLLKLSTSDYTQVRMNSQMVLFGCFEAFDFSVRSILPTLVENLKPEESVSHEKLKGTLYILLSSRVLLLITQYWEFMRIIWPAVVQSDQSEKTSIVSLINRLIRHIESKFETLSLNRMVDQNCRLLGEQLLLSKKPIPRCVEISNDDDLKSKSTIPSQPSLAKAEEMRQKGNKDNKKYYEDLLEELISFMEDPKLHWRSCEVCMKMLSLMLYHEYDPPAKLVKVLVDLLVHDSLKLRSIAIKGLAVVLEQQKRRLPKRVIPLSNYGVDPAPQNLLTLAVGDSRSDNKWLQYRPDEAPHSDQDLEKTVYIDKTYIGYYSWPLELKTYESYSVLRNFDCNIDNLNPVEQIIYNAFSQDEFLDRFFKFMSLENKKGEDTFRQVNFFLFKGLFRNYQCELLKKLEEKIMALLDDNVESKHRCCSEVLAGLITGSKNWNYEQLCYMWNFLGPLLRKTFSTGVMPEMLRDWGVALLVATGNRDPNRLHRLFDILLDNPVSGEGGSLGDSSRLFLLQSTISDQKWRVSQTYHRLLEYLLPHLSHPFKIVRDHLGSLLSHLFIPDMKNDFFAPTLSPHLETLVDFVIEDLTITSNEVLEMDHCKDTSITSQGEVKKISNGDLSLKNRILNADDEEKKRRNNLAKGVLSFLISLSFGMEPISKDIYRLIRVLIPLEAREDDPEMVNFCKVAFPRLSSKQIPLDLVESSVDSIIAVCNYNSWNARKCGLNFLKNMIYHNLFTFNDEEIKKKVQCVVINRLKDEQLEIREVASSFLSGLIHFRYIKVDKELLDGFLDMAHQKVRKIRYGIQLSSEEQRKNVTALRQKHGGILGLSACVLAFPYDVPMWVPEILLEIGKYLHSSPQVQEAVKKTLSEFRRTHHDNWQVHRQKFTDDQLAVLTDLLISPSYYA